MVDDVVSHFAEKALDWIVGQKERRNMSTQVCSICKKPFKSVAGLKVHMGKVHKEGIELSEEVNDSASPEGSSSEAAPPEISPPEKPEREQPESSAKNLSEDSPVPPVAEGLPPITPAPVEVPPKLTEIPEGSIIELTGTLYWRDPATGNWSPQTADNLPPAKVVQRSVTGDGSVSLLCAVRGGSAIWAVPEKAVLQGSLRVLEVPGMVPQIAPPPPVIPPAAPQTDPAEEESKRKEAERAKKKEAALRSYEPSIKRFGEAKKAKSAAEKEFKQVSSEERGSIESFVREYGTESEPEKGDFVVQEFGYKAHLIRTPGQPAIKRDTQKIEEFLTNSAEDWASNCLRFTLDVEKWEEAKAKKLVPDEFIREVEEIVQNDDTFALRVDPI